MLAEPSIWRRYHSPRVSSGSSVVLLERLDAFGEVPAHDHRVAPHVADQVGGQVRGERRAVRRARERRVHEVVLGGLLADLAQGPLEPGLELRGDAALLAQRVTELQVVHRDAVLEDARVDRVPQRLDQVPRLPRLVLVDAQDAVAEVVVLAEDVGEDVVLLVVRALPVLRRRRVVPLPRRASGSTGRASSPTGRAGRCGRSPCCRGPWPARGPWCR